MGKNMQSLNRDLFDLALKHALAELEAEQIKESCEIFDNLGEGTPLPIKARRNIKRVIKTSPARSLRRIAAGFALVLAVLVGSTTVASALGFNWIRMLFRSQPQYSGFTITNKTKEEYKLNEIEGLGRVYLPTYMPLDFELANVQASYGFYHLEYQDKNNLLTITQIYSIDGSLLDYDTENVDIYERIKVRGSEHGIYIEKSEYKAVFLEQDGIIINVEFHPAPGGRVSRKKLVRILEGLESISMQ